MALVPKVQLGLMLQRDATVHGNLAKVTRVVPAGAAQRVPTKPNRNEASVVSVRTASIIISSSNQYEDAPLCLCVN